MPSLPPARRTVWRRCRLAFRLLRIALLGSIFLALAALTWLRLFGLPDFLRLQLVDELARRGVVANFKSLHFHWFQGFVAEDLRVAWGGTNIPGLQFRIAEAGLDVAPPTAWRDRSSLLRGIDIRRASLVVPLPAPDDPSFELHLDDISARVRFLPGDQWDIPRLAARFEGLEFELGGSITNTKALRRSRPGAKPPDPAARERALDIARACVRELRAWTDASSAKITVHARIDGENMPGIHGDLFLEIPSADTPRGRLSGFRLASRLLPPVEPSGPTLHSSVLDLGTIETPQGSLDRLMFRAQLSGPAGSVSVTNATWEAHVEHLSLRGLHARQATLSGAARLAATNMSLLGPFDTRIDGHAARLEVARGPAPPLVLEHCVFGFDLVAALVRELPVRVAGIISSEKAEDSLGTSGPVRLEVDLSRRDRPFDPPPSPNLGPWAAAWPYSGRVEFRATNLNSPKLVLDRVVTDLEWQPPRLEIRRIDADLYRGQVRARGDLDVSTRVASASAEATFDLHGIDPLLGPRSRDNFVRYQWQSPPSVQGQARVTLPPWDVRNVDWNVAVKPTVRVEGRLKVGAGSFKGIPFDEATSTISFDGSTWRLPDLRTRRPEGRQEIAVEYNEDTREYRIDARGRVLPPVLKPVLGEQSAEIVDLFEFVDGVDADVVVWGPWTEGTRQSIHGSIVASNFTFRAQHFDQLEATVLYTNRFLSAAPVRLARGAGNAVAEGVGYDFEDDRLWLTNAASTIDPYVSAAAISPSLAPKLVHYRFATPPHITANGTLRPKDNDSADLRFRLEGGPFEFWRLRAETIESDLLWRGSTLTLTNVAARFHDGTLDGHAFFDLKNPEDSPYRFETSVRGAELGKILRHASATKTNVASGTIDFDLTVTAARTSDLYSWDGYGRAELRDGLLWDTPIFGFVSPILNGVVPGIANNRARAAEATFTLTNSVIHTRDLVIDCPPAKLFYRGTLDFDQNVNAKVEAQVLGNFTPMGPLFGLVLRPLTKLFEFRTTGTLTDVKAEPLYVPKFLLLPLQPLKLIRGLFGGGELSPRTTPLHSQPEIPLPPAGPTNQPPPSATEPKP